MTSTRRPAGWLALEALALTGIFGLLVVYVLRSMYGIDVFWHIRAGELILDTGGLPSTDTFSAVAPDRPWTTFQWLYEVIVYGLESLGGFWALRLSHAAVILVGFALLYRTARRRLGPVLALFVLTLAIVLFEDRFRVRPHVFNFLFLMILLPVVLGGWRRLRWRGRLGVAVLASIWANMHAGGALLVPVLLGGVLAGAVFQLLVAPPDDAGAGQGGLRGWWARRPGERRRELVAALWLFALAVLPMLAMPGFVKGVWTAVTMYNATVSLIPEWQETTAYFDMLDQAGVPHYLVCGFAPYVLMVALGLVVVLRILRRPGDAVATMDWPAVAASVLSLYLAQRSVRFIYLGLIPLLVMLADLVPALAKSERLRLRRGVVAVAAVVAVAFTGVSYHYNILVQRGSLARAVERIPAHLEPGRFPVEAAEFMADAGVEGRILHLSHWGGYLLWRLWPHCSVFADGRGNLDIAQVGTMIATHRAYDRPATLEAAWRIYDIDLVVFPAPVFHLYKWDRERWVRIYAGVDGSLPVEVFLRRTPANEEVLRRVRDWYGSVSDDPRFAGDDIVDFERAVARYWGYRWLHAPARQARLGKATERIEQAGSPAAKANALFKRGIIFYLAGAIGPAWADFDAAFRLAPGDARILYHLGMVLYRVGRNEDAAGALLQIQNVPGGPAGLSLDERIRRDLLLEFLLKAREG